MPEAKNQEQQEQEKPLVTDHDVSPMDSFSPVLQETINEKVDLPLGFDLSLFITLLVPLLVEMMQNCVSRELIVRSIRKRRFLARYATRKAVRKGLEQCGSTLPGRKCLEIESAVLDCCSGLPDAELAALIEGTFEVHDFFVI